MKNQLIHHLIKVAYIKLLYPLLVSRPEPIEAISSLIFFWWGILLLVAPEITEKELFATFEKLGHHYYFAAWFIILGASIFFIRFTKLATYSRDLMLLAAGTFGFMSGMLYLAHVDGLVIITYFILGLFCGWAHWRLRYVR